VPAGLASFGWAATRGISSYWAHPTTLTSFPVNEVLWMFGSPIALSALIASSARIVRGLELSPRVMRYETTLAVIATAVTLTLFFGAGAWVVDNGAPGPTGIYRVGLIDVAGLAVMATACAVAGRAVLRAHDAIRLRNHALVA
jgi:hypothetical protein